MTSRSTSALLALALAFAPGCAYLRDRVRDAARVVELDGGLTTGGSFHVGASHVVEAGFGWYSGTRWGLREGSFVEVDEERAEFGVPLLYLHEVTQQVESGSMPGRSRAGPLDRGYERFPFQWWTKQLVDRDPLDLHLGANAVYVGFNVSLRPYALLDFVAGWFGADLRDNDVRGREAADFADDLHSTDALVRRRAVARIQEITGRRWPSYRTPPRRNLFPVEERAALLEIEDDVRPVTSSRARSAAHAAAPQWLAPSPSDGLPPPQAAEPAEPADGR